MFFAPVKSRQGTKIWNMSVSKTTDYIQIKIKMSNSSQEPPASSKTWMFLATSKSREGTKIWDLGVSKTSDHIQIEIKMLNPSEKPPVSSKAPNQHLKDMVILCTLKFKIESWNFEHRYIKNQWLYPNQDQDAKPQSGTSRVLQRPKWGLKGHGCSLQVREPKFGPWVYQRPVTISK